MPSVSFSIRKSSRRSNSAAEIDGRWTALLWTPSAPGAAPDLVVESVAELGEMIAKARGTSKSR